MGRHALKVRKGIVGIEAAIILIAFVIISAAFAFMVINMGLFATQRSKDTISQGLREASSPLQVDGNIFVRVMENELSVNTTIIPLRAMGVKYVPVGRDETVVSLSIVFREGSSVSYANVYYGVMDGDYDPTGKSFDEVALTAYKYVNGTVGLELDTDSPGKLTIMYGGNTTLSGYTSAANITITSADVYGFEMTYVNSTDTITLDDDDSNGIEWFLITSSNKTGTLYIEDNGVYTLAVNGTTVATIIKTDLPAALLVVENSDGDEALDASEKGFLILLLGPDNDAEPRSLVTIEIRVEKSAPLTVEFMVPESLTEDSWMMVSG